MSIFARARSPTGIDSAMVAEILPATIFYFFRSETIVGVPSSRLSVEAALPTKI